MIKSSIELNKYSEIEKYFENIKRLDQLTSGQLEKILILLIPIWRSEKQDEKIQVHISDYLDISSKPAPIILKTLVEAHIRTNSIEQAQAALGIYINMYPDDIAAKELYDEIFQLIVNSSKKTVEEYKSKIKSKETASFNVQNLESEEEEEITEDVDEKVEEEIAESDFDKTRLIKEIDKIDYEIGKEEEINDILELDEDDVVEEDDVIKNIRKETLAGFSKGIEKELDISLLEYRSFELSPMLKVDVNELKFQDPRIIQKQGVPSVNDANFILKEADTELQKIINDNGKIFTLYGKYLEAAKAYNNLNEKEYDEMLYERALGRYAGLRGSAFYEIFKKAVLSKNSPEYVQKLKDSASSYYFEALRLKLDTTKKKMNPGFHIAEEVILNFLRLNAIHFYFENNIHYDKNTFEQNYLNTATNLIKSGGKEILAQTYINLGFANKDNFSSILKPTGAKIQLLNKGPRKILVNKNILNVIGKLTNIKRGNENSVNDYLNKIFEQLNINFKAIEKQFEKISDYNLNPSQVRQIKDKWENIKDDYDELIFSKTDYRLVNEIFELIEIYVPYYNKLDAERTAIIIHLKKELSSILMNIKDHPTYWSRVHLIPILNNWKNNIEESERSKSSITKPIIDISIDPQCILLKDDLGDITVGIENSGSASISELTCELKILVNNQEGLVDNLIEEFKIELEPKMKKSKTFSIIFDGFKDMSDIELDNYIDDWIFNITVKVSGINIDKTKEEKKENFDLRIQKTLTFEKEDIPWNEGRVKQDMFFGRDNLIEELTQHYLSHDRINPYVLYGLTRHGKSSIHRFLSKNLFNQKFITNEHGKLNFICFEWDFGEIDPGDARELWFYLIKDCIVDKIEDYASNGEIDDTIIFHSDFTKLSEIADNPLRRYKSIHLKKILQLLIDFGYFAFISIDEFTFYKQMIEKKIISFAFLQSLRKISLEDEKASFIFAGVFDLIEMVKDPGSTTQSQFAHVLTKQIASIDSQSSSELINCMGKKLVFTNQAVSLIQIASNNIPYFIQIICKNAALYAIDKGLIL